MPGICVPFCKFQSAPLTEARGDAGRYNQRNNKDLHRQMRDSFR